MSRHLLLPLLMTSLLLSSCASVNQSTQTHVSIAENTDIAKARKLSQQGEHQQAAQLYEQLASTSSTKQDELHLLAAQSFMLAGNNENTKQHLDRIERKNLSLDQQLLQQFFYAQYDLSVGDAELAIHQLKNLPISHFKHQDKITYYKSLAFAYSLTGESLKSIQQRIKLGLLLTTNEQQQNNAAIFEALNLLSLDTLRLAQVAPPDVLSGWLALTYLFKQNSPKYARFNSALAQWKQSYPNHPAHGYFLNQQLTKKPSKKSKSLAYTVAVLLPESGAYQQAGAAIRAGFVTAYQHSRDKYQPNFQFYDTESLAIAQLYQQAVNEGAELIIGPLNKKHLRTLLATTQLTVPVLALNYLPELSHKNLYQFSLSPLDDTEQSTAQAKADGYYNALILTASNKRGQRINQYFSDNWQSLHGRIFSNQTYPPKSRDFSKIIPKLSLHSNQGENSADVIFLSATAQTARSFNPQLNFDDINLPVYATSRIYQGHPNPARDKDLEGIAFCDLPWILNAPLPNYELSINNLRPVWEQFRTPYLRLVALGVDAFNLIPHLNKLKTQAYRGLTGKLYAVENNRIKRELACAKFIGGVPQLLETNMPGQNNSILNQSNDE